MTGIVTPNPPDGVMGALDLHIAASMKHVVFPFPPDYSTSSSEKHCAGAIQSQSPGKVAAGKLTIECILWPLGGYFANKSQNKEDSL